MVEVYMADFAGRETVDIIKGLHTKEEGFLKLLSK
jgi:hypothetical protein